MVNQTTLPGIDSYFLKVRLKESRRVVRAVLRRSEMPLIIQFSGGRDSFALLGLVREVTDNFVCAYMATGTEFPGVVKTVRETCAQLNVRLLVSNPSMHKGNIFKRIERFQSFPNLGSFNGGGKRLWCCRDLKLRPQKKLLAKTFGKGVFYKLEGIRRAESARRMAIYKAYTGKPIRPDKEHSGSFEVFPIINWTDGDVTNYLAMSGLSPLENLYRDFGVSGCSWCPFYGPDIYQKVLRVFPHHYDRWIEWEEKLNQPSVMGGVFLRDVKSAVLKGVDFASTEPVITKLKPCQMIFKGQVVMTCSVYGHLFIDGECLRCGEPEVKK